MKILGFAGSLRTDSYNKKLLRVALNFVKQAGAEIEEVDLKDLKVPLYDGDLENEIQLPEGIKKLRESISSANGILVATPEYNHSVPGVLKNTLDWVSRTKYFPSVTVGKPVAIFGGSDGLIGTARAQIALLPILNTLGMVLMPAKVYVSNVDKKFDEQGRLTDDKTEQKLKEFAESFVAFVSKFS